jgi:hypothetical protein
MYSCSVVTLRLIQQILFYAKNKLSLVKTFLVIPLSTSNQRPRKQDVKTYPERVRKMAREVQVSKVRPGKLDDQPQKNSALVRIMEA